MINTIDKLQLWIYTGNVSTFNERQTSAPNNRNAAKHQASTDSESVAPLVTGDSGK